MSCPLVRITPTRPLRVHTPHGWGTVTHRVAHSGQVWYRVELESGSRRQYALGEMTVPK